MKRENTEQHVFIPEYVLGAMSRHASFLISPHTLLSSFFIDDSSSRKWNRCNQLSRPPPQLNSVVTKNYKHQFQVNTIFTIRKAFANIYTYYNSSKFDAI